MYINKILVFGCVSLALAGCGGTSKYLTTKYDTIATSTPTDIQETYLYSTSLYGSDNGGRSANIAVLLPMSGEAKSIGNNIKTSIETAFLRKPKQSIKVSFYDVSGKNSTEAIRSAVYSDPDIIIGPLFAEDAKTLRDMKSSKTPAISFTSDVNALGDGVMTVNLIPTQSIEAIVQQMKQDGATNMIILAPDDNSGKNMAYTADIASDMYDIPVQGIFYYTSGNSDSIKDVSMRASMYNTRNAANTRAREVLSDILTKEKLDSATYNSLNNQLEKISRNETLGKLPYDAILFLGNGEDSKTLSSFLRYYGIGNRDVAFYGTTLWQGSDIASDFSMSGAKYATLPEISNNFVSLYTMVSGTEPDLLSAFGYDAANLALGAIYAQTSFEDYLYDPNGYIGTSGVFRIQKYGESERALRIMGLNGSGTPQILKEAPTNFLAPLYGIRTKNNKEIKARELSTRGINPGDYIKIPEYLRRKSEYKTKTIGANYTTDEDNIQTDEPIQIYASDEQETVSNPEYESVKKESVSRKYIDSVEVLE